MFKKYQQILVILLLLGLSGCKADLYSGLSEHEANEMITILLDNKIDVEKQTGLKNTVNIRVNSNDIGRSIAVLKKNGYPKDTFDTMGTIFKKDGLLSTPLEEKARYLHAVSQQLSETLSNLDGVLKARVHVVMPEVDEITKEIKNHASASVFIKHYQEVDLKDYIPKIKLLVNNSIPSLEYDRITVLLFASKGYQTIGAYQSDLKDIYDPEGVNKKEKIGNFFTYLIVSIVLIVLFNVGVILFKRTQGAKGPQLKSLFRMPNKKLEESAKEDAGKEAKVEDKPAT